MDKLLYKGEELAQIEVVLGLRIQCFDCSAEAWVKLTPPGWYQERDLPPLVFCLRHAAKFLEGMASEYWEDEFDPRAPIAIGIEPDGGAPSRPGSGAERPLPEIWILG